MISCSWTSKLDFEQIIITVGGVVIGAAVGALIAWMLKGKERKQSVEDKAALLDQVKVETADKLEEKRKQMATELKKETIAEVDAKFERHEAAEELHNHDIRSEMDARDITIESYHKEFIQFRKYDYLEFKKNLLSYLKNQKFNQEVLQTVAFGDTAHSTPYWMFGLEKPPGEDEKAGEGAFFIQSEESRDLQKLDNEERMRLDAVNAEKTKPEPELEGEISASEGTDDIEEEVKDDKDQAEDMKKDEHKDPEGKPTE
jgi:hypothetical protein